MRKVLVIAAREYKAAVKTKSFLIGIILMPIMMSGGLVAQVLLGDHVDPAPKHFAIIDRTPGQEFAALLAQEADKHNRPQADAPAPTTAPFLLEVAPPLPDAKLPEQRLALSDRVRKGELTGFLEIGPEVMTLPDPPAGKGLDKQQMPPPTRAGGRGARPTFSPELMAYLEPYALRYQSNRPSYQDFAIWAEKQINTAIHARRGAQKGLTAQDLKVLDYPVPLFGKGLTTRNSRTGAIEDAPDQNPLVAMLLPGGLLVLMFMMVMVGAAPLLQGVMEEKMQRIAEVLLGSVQPFPLMMGKILGMACVSLTMTAIYLACIFWGVNSYGYGEFLSAEIIVWFLIYQVLALFLYGSLYAAVGAACSDLKEAQTMLMPVTLISIMPLFVWFVVVREPTSTFSTLASLFPLATPTLMVARLAVPPGIPIWQPLLGIVLVLLTTLLCVYAAGRIFRVGILMQGKGPRLPDLYRWVFRG